MDIDEYAFELSEWIGTHVISFCCVDSDEREREMVSELLSKLIS